MVPAGGGRPPAHRARDTTRWDIQGLRALAVVAVIVYHLWPRALPGGFVGVDVFFVVSGYLITGHLLREQVATGRIALGRFWARRAKRLLPTASIVAVVTGTAVLTLVPSALWGQYGRELVASAVSVQNWVLAASSVDYLASDDQGSPFQHFWSLSVEEQCYVVLPLLLLAAAAVVRRRASPVVTARVLLGAVVLASLTWSVVQTATTPGVAYFSTATRAWEFALGGLVATVTLPVVRTTRALVVRTVGAGLGVAGLAVSLVVVGPTLPFPGIVALLPVASAALVVLFGAGTVFEDAGALAPVRTTGRISYALYLWHWPAAVIVPLVLGDGAPWGWRVAVLVGSFLLAAVTTVFVEEPVRSSPPVRRLPPLGVAFVGVVTTLVVVALGASTLSAARVEQEQSAAAAERVERAPVSCFGAAARIGLPDACTDPGLADTVVPAPAAARADDPNRAECWSGAFRPCVLGQTSGWTKRLLVVGDSHSNALLEAYDRIAKERHWRIDLAGTGGCYLTTAVQDGASAASQRGCTTWKRQAIRWVRDQRSTADALVVTHSATQMQVEAPAGARRDAATRAGLVDAWSRAAGHDLPVVAIRDNPVPRRDVIACVSRAATPTDGSCDVPRSRAFRPTDSSAAAVRDFVAAGGRAALVDLSDHYCTATTCPAVVGGVLVYRDSSHITGTWARTLTPYLGRALSTALDRLDRQG